MGGQLLQGRQRIFHHDVPGGFFRFGFDAAGQPALHHRRSRTVRYRLYSVIVSVEIFAFQSKKDRPHTVVRGSLRGDGTAVRRHLPAVLAIQLVKLR